MTTLTSFQKTGIWISISPLRLAKPCISVLVGLIVCLTLGCGSTKASQTSAVLAGNWQFTMAAPADASFGGTKTSFQTDCGTASANPCPLQLGGFLLQNSNSVSGQVSYSITVAGQKPGSFPCSGSASTNGTLNGQNVNLVIQAASQTFSLNGTLSGDGKTMMGTYTSVGTDSCGTAQSGLQWSAVSVPSISGAIEGFLHSRAPHVQFNPDFPSDQDFPVSGVLTQGPNIGASNATVTGTLSFQGGYSCLGSVASVNGEISGSSVILQIVAGNGLNVGQIGTQDISNQQQPAPVSISSTSNGLIVAGQNGYAVTSKKCPGSPGDYGNICLATGSGTACTQPVLMTPASLTFPPQLLGTTTSQTITLTNQSGASLTGLNLSFISQSGTPNLFNTPSDFTGQPNFTEHDNCAPSLSAPFTLAAGQSCSITVSFSPQQSCPWLPLSQSGSPTASSAGAPPTYCPPASKAKVIMATNSASSNDSDTAFAVPVTGTGLSSIVPFPAELDFGSETPGQKSPPQSITFTNQGTHPVEILPSSATACGTPNQVINLPRPITPGAVSGLQVVQNGGGFNSILPVPSTVPTVSYSCDQDSTSGQANFQLVSDSCSGRTLLPHDFCSVQMQFVPQPNTPLVSGLDFFLELNTLQCAGAATTGCEIDSGRFPVELKANLPSPLRMTPGAGLDFGIQTSGQSSSPRTVTLFNDPHDPNAGVVNFTGNRVQGDYFETDNCGISLAPGSSCTMTITFTPQIVGLDPGNILIGYTIGNTAQLPQTIYLRGTGQ